MMENMEKYDFVVTLDNIALNFNSDEVKFISERNKFCSKEEIVVNFNYTFTPWDLFTEKNLTGYQPSRFRFRKW
jgi:hypothetical protein